MKSMEEVVPMEVHFFDAVVSKMLRHRRQTHHLGEICHVWDGGRDAEDINNFEDVMICGKMTR